MGPPFGSPVVCTIHSKNLVPFYVTLIYTIHNEEAFSRFLVVRLRLKFRVFWVWGFGGFGVGLLA